MGKFICKRCMIPCKIDLGDEIITLKPFLCPVSGSNQAAWEEMD